MTAFVRGVTRRSTSTGSMFSVSPVMSANTGHAPRKTTALAVDTKVKLGMITSSPGFTPRTSMAISSACVHDVVR